MAEYGLLIDYEYCTGCESCVVACKEEHGFPVGKWGIRVLDDGPWQKDDSGEGGNCFNWNKIPVPTDLCDLCADRVAGQGRPSMCYCCTLCNECGRADEMKSKLGKRECFSCKALISDNELRVCPNCGAQLPPPFPPIPGSAPAGK